MVGKLELIPGGYLMMRHDTAAGVAEKERIYANVFFKKYDWCFNSGLILYDN